MNINIPYNPTFISWGEPCIVTATYLGNGRFHVAGIEDVSRCTTASWVALNWSLTPSK